MIDPTNIPPVLNAAPQSFTASLNAWHLIALGAGVAVTHAYHVVVNAGGLKKIVREFINGKDAAK